MASPTPPVELVIFDCDGVLIDSEIISARVLLALLKTVGVSVDFAHFQANFLGRSWPKVVADIRINYGLSLGEEFEESYRGKLLKAFETELETTPGVREILAGLKVASCVATSSTRRRLTRSMEITGLDRHFGDNTFTASQVENGKPAPDLFLLAARTMGVTPERCLVIEDSAPGIEGARRAGMRCYHYTGGKHLRGHEVPDSGVMRISDWHELAGFEPALFETST
ncbi:HAD family hydrolase [Pseudohoeflea suaedae]|uniref:HAD family hydrolase n=1 Tax=Pseudohoeflea suaedae TaxID=877384 RepID=A0A4R5PNZ5_9HYPH|nr:HAD family hydrolase [Pseudohoeflea suaedae]TDH38766.1 HAD family hydrolase [Pseudohoeflea suaedae]